MSVWFYGYTGNCIAVWSVCINQHALILEKIFAVPHSKYTKALATRLYYNLHNYQYITDWDHSDWSPVYHLLLHQSSSYRSGEPRHQGVPQLQLLFSSQVRVFIGSKKKICMHEIYVTENWWWLCHCTCSNSSHIWSESWSRCRQHKYQSCHGCGHVRVYMPLLVFTTNMREALWWWCTQWTIQQQLVLPCPTSSATQSTPSWFIIFRANKYFVKGFSSNKRYILLLEEKPLPITLKTSCKHHEHIMIIHDVFKVIKCIIVTTAPLLLPLGGLCHQNEPTVSPCSAGVGKTGTLISIMA